jgi:autotransporter passenger strand-loop-strand repeat protein
MVTSITVSSGVTSTGLTLTSGTIIFVSSGGTISNITLENGAESFIYAGGVDSGANIQDASGMTVFSGGNATFDTIQNGGNLTVKEGGAVSHEVLSGSSEYLSGTSLDTKVDYYGEIDVRSGGVDSGATLTFVHSQEIVSLGGLTTGTEVLDGATQTVLSGGMAFGAVLEGVQIISAGGIVGNTQIDNGGTQFLSAGISATDDMINSGGVETISGGIDQGTTINTGGTQFVAAGSAIGTTISSGGQQIVTSGGTAYGAIVAAGGLALLSSGANAMSTTVMSGGVVIVLPGAKIEAGGAVISTGVVSYKAGSGFSETLTTSGQVLNAGDEDFVLTGGIVSAAQIGGGAIVSVYAGGQDLGGTIAGGTVFLSAGATDSGMVITGGGVDILSSGAVSDKAVVDTGGIQMLYGGADASGTVFSGGGQILIAGAETNNATLTTTGLDLLVVSSGGTASDTVISAGATLAIFGGATIGSTTFLGGTEIVGSGAVVESTIAAGGLALQILLSGGRTVYEVITAGGRQIVSSGGTSVDTTVAAGGTLSLIGGDDQNAAGVTAVESGGLIIVGSGGFSSAYISAGGVEIISAGGGASSFVRSGGTEIVSSGGNVDGGTVSSGGTLIVSSGGATGGEQISSGGQEIVLAGGASGATAQASLITTTSNGGILIGSDVGYGAGVTIGGTVTVSSGGISYFAQLSGGQQFVSSGGIASGSNIFGGTETVYSGGIDRAADINGGVLIIDNGATAAGIVFTGTGGMLDFGGSNLPDDTIAGFGFDDRIDLTNDAFGGTPTLTANGDFITITGGGETATFDFVGDAGDPFHLTPDGGTGIYITPCFLAGTLIRTDRGDVPVESLNIGDRVLNHAGQARPIKWLGRRAYRQPFASNNNDIIPILICKNALGPNRPSRDLYVSPLHAMFIDDVLVPAGLLVNGASIRRCPDMPEIRYIHIELASHDVIFAENAATETFVDCDSRNIFQNAAEFAQLYPADASPGWTFCAPRVTEGQSLRAIWRKLATRAQATGGHVTAPADARLIGHIEHVSRARIAGWAYLPDHKHEAVELEILDGDGVLARVVANQPRPDLARACIGDGRHGFALTFFAGLSPAAHQIRFRRAGTDKLLAEAPVILEAVTPQIRAVLHHDKPAARMALVMDTTWPDPNRDAGSRAILSHITALQQLGYNVSLIATEALDTPPPPALLDSGITCLGAPAFPTVESVLRRRGQNLALVYMHRLAVAGPYAALVAALCPAAHKIFSVADLHHLRLRGQALVESDAVLAAQAKAAAARELFAMRQVDAVITHSPREAQYLARNAPGVNVHVVPWHLAVPRKTPAFAARQGVGFIGSFAHAPNQDAVRHLLSDIMPLVWRQNPLIRLQLAGSGWPPFALPALDPRIDFIGEVTDLNAFLGGLRLTIAPLRFGAGIKGKVLDSFAAGTPCVLSPMAAEGMALTAALQAAIGEDAGALARLICDIHENESLNRNLAKAGQAHIRRHATAAATTAALARACFPAPQLAGTG